MVARVLDDAADGEEGQHPAGDGRHDRLLVGGEVEPDLDVDESLAALLRRSVLALERR